MKRLVKAALCLGATLCMAAGVHAADAADGAANYPNRPIRLIVGYVAGGVPDGLARALGETLSKTLGLGDIRSMEIRATLNNVFNTVQYSGVDTNVTSPTFGQVVSTAPMRSFQFTSRFRF